MLARVIQRFPTGSAVAGYAVAVALAFWGFWRGRSLLNPFSDQTHVYPFRKFAVEYLKQYGDVAGWNPYILGGMPFAANVTNGDTFYPSMLLRLFLPVDVGITLGFLIHILLAGAFTFLFLRALKLDWGAAFVGGAAYMFTGQLVSLVTAGHDGKLAVSALMPLALLCLYRAVSLGAWRWYVGFGVVVGLSLLSPHVQLTYYLLMAAGFFWLFMVVWSRERPIGHAWWHSALLFGGGLAVGFALDGIQLIPFAEYVAYSPRGAAAAAAGASSTGWAYATSYAMPPEELLNVVWPSFSGMVENYWGRNFLKYHSEYLGIAPLMLACLGFGLTERRRMAWFFAFLITYGVLFALGGHTPFYRLPYHLLPGIRMTRGAGMIFFLAAFGVAVLAGFGVQTLLRGAGQVRRGFLMGWLAVLGAGVILAVAGGFKGIMLSFAPPQRLAVVDANYGTFTWDTLRGFMIALGAGSLVLALQKKRLVGDAWGLALGGLVLLDLWSVEQRQIRFGQPARQLFAADSVVRAVSTDSGLYRLLPVPSSNSVYWQDNYLMAHGIRSVLGYQGTELHRYDELLGGKNEWRNVGNPNLWRLLAIKYIVIDRAVELPELVPVGEGPLAPYQGPPVHLYRYVQAQPFAWLVRAALEVPDNQARDALMDPRFDPRRLVLVPPEAGVGKTELSALPEPVADPVEVVEERPGQYRFTLNRPAVEPAYLFVSEPHYPAWRATVDGSVVPVVRAQYALMAVPIPAGARSVELAFQSRSYQLGRLLTLAALLLVGTVAAHSWWRARGRAGDG